MGIHKVKRQRQKKGRKIGTGTYVLVLRMPNRSRIKVGRLGRLDMRQGYYSYVGSAFGPGGLPARLHHHLRPALRPHWHIDYLRKRTLVDQVWYAVQATPREHEWVSLFDGLLTESCAISRFGSTDCRCNTHLFYSHTRPDVSLFAQLTKTHFPSDGPVKIWEQGSRELKIEAGNGM